MAEAQISRYRPAVLAIASIAAAYGIWILYLSRADQYPHKSSLRRSNAVHRQRNGGQRIIIDFTLPDQHGALGWVVARRGTRECRFNMAFEEMPTVEEVRRQLGDDIDGNIDLQHQLNTMAVRCILQACYIAAHDRYADLQRFSNDQQQIIAWLAARDFASVQAEGLILLAAGIPFASAHEIDTATIAFLRENGLPIVEPFEGNDDLTIAETTDDEAASPDQPLTKLIYHFTEENERRRAYEHRGIHCEECGEGPIRGIRWHCLNCPNFDLCSTCESRTRHYPTHVLVKIKIPIPMLSQPTKELPSWYSGECTHSPTKSILLGMKQVEEELGFTAMQIQALADQYSCVTRDVLRDDDTGPVCTIDRVAFNRALTSERWEARFRPNVVFDRMFAFYDTDGDGMISPREFVSGIAYLTGPKRYASLHRALQGYDIDNDGYVERADFLRLLRAKYEISCLITRDMLDAQEDERKQEVMSRLRASQPISAIFADEDIPVNQSRQIAGKAMSRYDDMEPQGGAKTILEPAERLSRIFENPPRNRGQSNVASQPPHQRLQSHLSRFEELLDGPVDSDSRPQGSEGKDEPNAPQGDGKVSASTPLPTERDFSFSEDVMWTVVEDALNQQLDHIFGAREAADSEAKSSRPSREKWRKEVDEALEHLEKRNRKRKEWQAGAYHDPSLADPLEQSDPLNRSYALRDRDHVVIDDGLDLVPELRLRPRMVPTDSESLARYEAEISQRPLEELLEATGYGIAGGSAASERPSQPSPQPQSHQEILVDEVRPDPTLPQNRPTSASPEAATSSSSEAVTNGANTDGSKAAAATRTEENAGLTPEYLEILVHLEQQEREMNARGGPGRLSYDEVEEIVGQDPTRQLRGLVISWLEWASF